MACEQAQTQTVAGTQTSSTVTQPLDTRMENLAVWERLLRQKCGSGGPVDGLQSRALGIKRSFRPSTAR